MDPAAETLFEEMKRYVRFAAEDARLLREFGLRAAPSFPRIADEFYDRIREHVEAHAVLRDEEQVERLKKSLVRWMTRVCDGPHDEGYFAETAKIGRVHVKVGLPQRYMFTAMSLIRQSFEQIADAELGAHNASPHRIAIAKVLYLELAIMLETYRDDFLARAQAAERLERAELGKTLARAEHRYETAVELARVMVIGLDAKGVVRLFNREAERVTGWGREEVIGGSFERLAPVDMDEARRARLRAAFERGEVESEAIESAVATRSGKVRDVRWRLAYTPSAVPDEVVLFALGADITDERALAQRLLQNEKLAAVGTLAAGLAHEIRNPLNGAQLHVTFLERGLKRAGIEDTDTREAVAIVRDEIQRLSVLVTEFLDFARPKPLEPKPASIVALCQHAAQLVAADVEAARVELRLDLPHTDIETELDPPKIQQVLLNLLHNAIDAVASIGGGAVTLRARRQPRKVVLEVEDEGPGLPSPDAPVFDPFFSTKPQGTGLGLAIAHRIVTDHGGAIDFHTRPGKTVFRVALPLHASRAHEGTS